MASRNDVTGDSLISKGPTDAYRDGWDRIFGKKKDMDTCNIFTGFCLAVSETYTDNEGEFTVPESTLCFENEHLADRFIEKYTRDRAQTPARRFDKIGTIELNQDQYQFMLKSGMVTL